MNQAIRKATFIKKGIKSKCSKEFERKWSILYYINNQIFTLKKQVHPRAGGASFFAHRFEVALSVDDAWGSAYEGHGGRRIAEGVLAAIVVEANLIHRDTQAIAILPEVGTLDHDLQEEAVAVSKKSGVQGPGIEDEGAACRIQDPSRDGARAATRAARTVLSNADICSDKVGGVTRLDTHCHSVHLDILESEDLEQDLRLTRSHKPRNTDRGGHEWLSAASATAGGKDEGASGNAQTTDHGVSPETVGWITSLIGRSGVLV